MALDSREQLKLRRVIAIVQKLIAESPKAKRGRPPLKSSQNDNGKRVRRTGKALTQFRAKLMAERKKGARVSDIAKKYKVSSAYIYQLRA